MSSASADPLEFKAATADDAELHARIYTSTSPDEPVTAEMVLESWREAAHSGHAERYTLLEAGEAIGLAGIAHWAWTEVEVRAARLEADFVRERRNDWYLARGLDFVEERAVAEAAEHLITHARESDEFLIRHLRRRGYGGKDVFGWWEIDLAGRQAALEARAAAVKEAMARAGVRMLTFAEAGPAAETGLAELVARLGQPRAEAGFKESLTEAPGIRRELSWVAVKDGRLLAASLLTCHEGGNAWLEWLGGDPDAGEAARALEAMTLSGAVQAGERVVRAQAGEPSEARLERAWQLGWRVVPGMIQFHLSVADRQERRRRTQLSR